MRSLCLAVLLLSLACCSDLPRDQKGTVKRIRETGEMRAGLIENPPWVVRTTGEPAGTEVDALRDFAGSLGATPSWEWGGEEKLLGSLENYNLDIVAGGLSDSTPWQKRVGLTDAYRDDRVLAVPPGENQLIRKLDEFMETRQKDQESR
jgi:polar amino acid transport system substrate-binding protein